MKRDIKEKLWWYKKKFNAVERVLEQEFASTQKGLGFCHVYWARKKKLLKEMYNIDWKTPIELNPGIQFD